MTRIRLKQVREKEQEQTRKIAELMNTYKVPVYPNYNYQPTSIMVGASAADPIQKVKSLFQLFGLSR